VERVRQLERFGFRHAMFEDNYPAGVGDCYSLKAALSGGGFVPPAQRDVSLYGRLRRRLSGSAPQVIPSGDEDARWLQANLVTYCEFPPVVKPETTRWNDAWTDDAYPTPEPLCDPNDRACPAVFRDEARDYTWLCYVQL
jgi:hypothetical protein